jgi:hypothetical protein
MKVKDLFKTTNISQSIGGLATFLDKGNCQITNKTRKDNAVALELKREIDGEEGHAYLRVQDQFETLSDQLLNWAFNNDSIIGLTLNELENTETNLEIEKIQDRFQLKHS